MIYDEYNQVENTKLSYPGWAGIIDGLLFQLRTLDVDIVITQVKEKFGSLRFYFDFATDVSDVTHETVHTLVGAAELSTCNVCILCAAPKTREGTGSWIRFFCDQHNTEDLKEYWRKAK